MERRVEGIRESRGRETGKGFRVVESEGSFLRDPCRNVQASTEWPANRFANRSILLSFARPENRSSTFPGQNHLKFLARRFRSLPRCQLQNEEPGAALQFANTRKEPRAVIRASVHLLCMKSAKANSVHRFAIFLSSILHSFLLSSKSRRISISISETCSGC